MEMALMREREEDRQQAPLGVAVAGIVAVAAIEQFDVVGHLPLEKGLGVFAADPEQAEMRKIGDNVAVARDLRLLLGVAEVGDAAFNDARALLRKEFLPGWMHETTPVKFDESL